MNESTQYPASNAESPLTPLMKTVEGSSALDPLVGSADSVATAVAGNPPFATSCRASRWATRCTRCSSRCPWARG